MDTKRTTVTGTLKNGRPAPVWFRANVRQSIAQKLVSTVLSPTSLRPIVGHSSGEYWAKKNDEVIVFGPIWDEGTSSDFWQVLTATTENVMIAEVSTLFAQRFLKAQRTVHGDVQIIVPPNEAIRAAIQIQEHNNDVTK